MAACQIAKILNHYRNISGILHFEHDALITTESIIPSSVQAVTIADKEADFYDLFACPRHQGSDFLIRVLARVSAFY